jgi:DNA helicase-2/ATP-dependent DNA helicase PcrA
VDRALAEAYRTPSREALAQWAEEAFTGGDAVRRRVAEAVDRFLTSGASGGFRAWVELYTPFDDLISDRQPAVAVTTFHAAKGREWPAVIIAGVESGLVPHSSAVGREQLAEEARLFYVSITRAASRLWLSSATRRGGRPVSPSPWLSAVEATASHDAVAAPRATGRTRLVDDFAPWRAWRHNIARAAGVDDHAVCSDRVLRSLRDDPPLTTAELSRRLGITADAASRLPDRPET